MNEKVFYTIAEVRNLTGAAISTLYLMRERGELVFRKFGGKTVILKTDLDAYLANLPVCPAEARPHLRLRKRRAA